MVLFAWTPEATNQQKQRVVEELRTLPPLLSGLRAYHVGPDAAVVEGNADFAIVADFDDAASYLAYRNHPAHRAIVEQVVNPIIKERVAVQYEI
ncbi:MAG TPA: Dabb family protein [Streptosporangiaceae bacterium]|nr:Dabb family protein [Streptosporangiaceae bacterium]